MKKSKTNCTKPHYTALDGCFDPAMRVVGVVVKPTTDSDSSPVAVQIRSWQVNVKTTV